MKLLDYMHLLREAARKKQEHCELILAHCNAKPEETDGAANVADSGDTGQSDHV